MAPGLQEAAASVNEVVQLLQEWETLSREPTPSPDRLIATLKRLADVVERETDNFYKQVIYLCTIHVK